MNKKRKPRKKLSTGLMLLIILVFSIVFILFGVCIGFLINSFINPSTSDILACSFFTLLVGIIYMILLLILIRNKDIENVKSTKWYTYIFYSKFNCYCSNCICVRR